MLPQSVVIQSRRAGSQAWMLAVMLTVLGAPVRAASQATITWSAPTQCPQQHEVTARVLALLGHDVDATTSAHVHVAQSNGVYRAELQLSSAVGSGRRTLEEADCSKLADAVALVFALATPHSPQSERAWRWTFAVFGEAMLGPLPALAGGGRASLGVELSLLRLELNASYVWPQAAPLGDGVLSGEFRLAAASVGVGPVVHLGALEVVPELGVAGYHFTVTGLGGATSRTRQTLDIGPALSVLIRVRVSERWALCSSLVAVAVVRRSRFVFSDAGSLHEVPLLNFNAGVGVELQP